jgi:antitoxin component YwqK of YwqJK toxin-antitoxin module
MLKSYQRSGVDISEEERKHIRDGLVKAFSENGSISIKQFSAHFETVREVAKASI